MAVQTNAQAQVTAVSSTVLPNNAFVPSVQGVPTNSVIQTMLPPSNVSTNARPQLQQVRLVQAVSSSTANSLPRQHQIVRIIKQGNGDTNTVSNANIINVRPPSASPMKGGMATLINLPVSGSAKVLPHGTKLKVGDTITIPKLNLEHDKETNDLSAGQTLVTSTPTNLVRVDGCAGQSPAFLNRVSAPNSMPSTGQIATVIPANTSFAQVTSPDRLSTISASWAQSPLRYKRPSVFSDTTQGSETKRRRTPTTEKGSKGLRHFAMLVCEKVKQKVTTTYNEVADELVAEYSDSQRHLSEQQYYDQKNIRRRVYDALNVLMAMDIIYKDKKDIHWVGLPTNSAQEVQSLQAEKKKREQRIQQKTLQLQELILQQIAFKNLVQRNKRLQQTQGPPAENSAIQLPFIIVNTSKKTVIDCSISNDKYEYMFNFDNTFEIHDDIEVLKRMGMAYGLEAGTCSKENLKTAQTLVPPVLKPYLEQMAGYSKTSSNDDVTSTTRYVIQDAPRIVSNESNNDSNTFAAPPDKQRHNPVKMEPDVLDLDSCFSIGQILDANDQEVAMVTDGSQISGSSSGITTGFTSSSRSSSSGLHSAVLSLTPMSSSGGSESRGSTPLDSQES